MLLTFLIMDSKGISTLMDGAFPDQHSINMAIIISNIMIYIIYII